jgi:hypothetical protein
MNNLVPLRPDNDNFTIPKLDKDILTYSVLVGCDNHTAFLRFHPEYYNGHGKLNDMGKIQCKHFFSYPKNRAYADAYRDTLEKFLMSGQSAATQEVANRDVDSSEERTETVMRKLMSDVLDSIEANEKLDAEVLKDFVDIAKKLNIVKDDTEREVKPIRFLPARCKSECLYCFWVEKQKLDGGLLDECDYCRAKKYAVEQGFKYEPRHLLDIPEEVIKQIEEANDVELEDLLSHGQQERENI